MNNDKLRKVAAKLKEIDGFIPSYKYLELKDVIPSVLLTLKRYREVINFYAKHDCLTTEQQAPAEQILAEQAMHNTTAQPAPEPVDNKELAAAGPDYISEIRAALSDFRTDEASYLPHNLGQTVAHLLFLYRSEIKIARHYLKEADRLRRNISGLSAANKQLTEANKYLQSAVGEWKNGQEAARQEVAELRKELEWLEENAPLALWSGKWSELTDKPGRPIFSISKMDDDGQEVGDEIALGKDIREAVGVAMKARAAGEGKGAT